MFLTKADISATLYPDIRDMIARYSDALIEMSLSSAQGEIETMLGTRYAIASEMVKTGDNRHKYLLSIARDLAVYHLYSLQESIPAHRTKRYEQAIAMLKLMQDGKSTLPGVALVPPDANPGQLGQIGFTARVSRVSLNDAFSGYTDTPPPIPSNTGYV